MKGWCSTEWSCLIENYSLCFTLLYSILLCSTLFYFTLSDLEITPSGSLWLSTVGKNQRIKNILKPYSRKSRSVGGPISGSTWQNEHQSDTRKKKNRIIRGCRCDFLRPTPEDWREVDPFSVSTFFSWLHGRFPQSLSCFLKILLVFVWFISIFHYCSKVSFQVFLFLFIWVSPAIFTYPCISYIYVCNTLACLLVSQSIQRYLSYLSDIVCFCLFVSLFFHLSTNFPILISTLTRSYFPSIFCHPYTYLIFIQIELHL